MSLFNEESKIGMELRRPAGYIQNKTFLILKKIYNFFHNFFRHYFATCGTCAYMAMLAMLIAHITQVYLQGFKFARTQEVWI